MRASAVSMRRNSCSLDISRLNTPTVISVFVPTCCAMLSARLVFPIDGRAAMMIRSEGWSPDVISSRSVKPVGTPVISSFRACSFSMVSRLDLREVPQRDEAVAHLVIGNGEDRVLGLIEDDVGLLVGLVRRREDLVRREDQVPECRLLLDDARVVLDVGRARHAVHERGDVGRASDLVDLARPAELLLQRDQVDGVAPFGEPDHLVEDPAVGIAEEVAGVDDLGGEVESAVVQKNRAEDRTFGFEVMRKRAFGDSEFRHHLAGKTRV